MPGRKVGPSNVSSKYQVVDNSDIPEETEGRDRQLRSVKRSAGQRLMKHLVTARHRWRSRRSIKLAKPIITPYHRKIGHSKAELEPSLNNRPFYDFWQVKDGAKNFTDTVDHQVMEVKQADGTPMPIDGVWHVKSPGRESRGTRFKRFLQKIVYHITGQDYKGYYYDDHKLLVQKEVLATNLYRAVVLEDDNPDQDFEEKYQCGYSYDDQKRRHCIAIRHLDGYKDASKLFHQGVEGPDFRIFDDKHNPASDLVIRRFFLGDEDYLKLDNYMYKSNADQQARTKMYCIDFGMAFYNLFHLPKKCSYSQFCQRLLAKSQKHQVQYAGKPTMMTVLRLMNPGQVESGIRSALEKIARMSDDFLERQCWHVHNEEARTALMTMLKFKRQQARVILDPSESWPDEPGRDISDALVADDHPVRHS